MDIQQLTLFGAPQKTKAQEVEKERQAQEIEQTDNSLPNENRNSSNQNEPNSQTDAENSSIQENETENSQLAAETENSYDAQPVEMNDNSANENMAEQSNEIIGNESMPNVEYQEDVETAEHKETANYSLPKTKNSIFKAHEKTGDAVVKPRKIVKASDCVQENALQNGQNIVHNEQMEQQNNNTQSLQEDIGEQKNENNVKPVNKLSNMFGAHKNNAAAVKPRQIPKPAQAVSKIKNIETQSITNEQPAIIEQQSIDTQSTTNEQKPENDCEKTYTIRFLACDVTESRLIALRNFLIQNPGDIKVNLEIEYDEYVVKMKIDNDQINTISTAGALDTFIPIMMQM